jgi:hypothetical protein
VILELFVGSRFTGISVRPDAKWPNMWRVHHGKRVSDMVNLTRAKDAARSWADLTGGGERSLVNWRAATSPPDGPPVRQTEVAYVE